MLYNISIHAPSRERPTCLDCSIPQNKFQSTLPRGSDFVLFFALFCYIIFQSTLPRGSDNGLICRALTLRIFQSTLPRGSDRYFDYEAFARDLFQSTLPRGSDKQQAEISDFSDNFNPRSLAGATEQRLTLGASLIISIHAPSRERLAGVDKVSYDDNFNPRSLAGATSFRQGSYMINGYFNPRSLAGATQRLLIVKLVLLFQSTLPRGSDLSLIVKGWRLKNFNPRSLAGATASKQITSLFI